ncbi:uncharacterized protein B0H64DRAFT_404856 [Chaetomium fimeti]|uniref:Secreted protein n=1 Tax=Chaetomium fimeti TaxID=1854472 RepID=A0AAE0HBZ9_9PEZI|nr:hypothetical protein B0H64DRAFT_404856 [Chaetomium fimeti]
MRGGGFVCNFASSLVSLGPAWVGVWSANQGQERNDRGPILHNLRPTRRGRRPPHLPRQGRMNAMDEAVAVLPLNSSSNAPSN